MNTKAESRFPRRRREPAGGPVLWVPLAAGLLFMLLAALARGDAGGYQAKRTERFNARLSAGSTLRIENVSGDIAVTSGREFSAVVTLAVTASSQRRADEVLSATRIVQSHEDGDLSLETRWPGSGDGLSRRPRSSEAVQEMRSARCHDCKVTARYEVAVPPGVRVRLATVNGEVRADGLDGDLDLQTVNGGATVRGARQAVKVQSVNGKIDVIAQVLPPSAAMNLRTVNGSVLLTLPKDAKFDLSASAMSGAIASTFPLPVRVETEPAGQSARRVSTPSPPRLRTLRQVAVEKGMDESVVVDLGEMEKDLEESMKEADVQVRESLREVHREMRRFKVFLPGNEYVGSIGQDGAPVHLSTLNGSITVIASGTAKTEAKALVSPHRSFAIEVPRIEVRLPHVKVRPPTAVAPAIPPVAGAEGEVVRGDIAGDFLATAGGGSYRIGNVGGRVRIVTHAGEIHVASAGGSADLKTYGGDITIGDVHGELVVRSLAGDVQAGAVFGSAAVETSGGDIRIEGIGGSADVRTGGGDIVLKGVAGAVQARTDGGDIRIALVSRDPRGGVSVHDGGGDVTLTLPGNARAEVELEVAGCGDTEPCIRSDFPEIAVLRGRDSTHAAGSLNGGGPRVVVRTSSGTISLRRGPAASGREPNSSVP